MKEERINECIERIAIAFNFVLEPEVDATKEVKKLLAEQKQEIEKAVSNMNANEVFSDLNLCPYTIKEVATKIKELL